MTEEVCQQRNPNSRAVHFISRRDPMARVHVLAPDEIIRLIRHNAWLSSLANEGSSPLDSVTLDLLASPASRLQLLFQFRFDLLDGWEAPFQILRQGGYQLRLPLGDSDGFL